MNNKEQDNCNNATLDLIKKFVDSNQRKRINSLTQIESEVENIFNLGPSLFDMFDSCLLYTSPSPRDFEASRMPSSA